MMPATRTRFRCGCPLSDLKKLTIMFKALILQYLNELVKSKVRDFPPPKAFHAVKVQGLGDNVIKPTAEVSGTFVVPISALVADLAMKPCEFTDGTPPIVRTFYLSTDRFVESAKFFQGLFQGLRMVNLFTGAECQIGLHTEVYPYAFTCSGQHFLGGIICNDIEPIRSDSIPTDLNIADISVPIAMLMEREIDFLILIELLGTWVPHSKRDTDTPVFKFVGIRKLRRTVFLTLFELRGTDTSASLSFFEKIKKLSE